MNRIPGYNPSVTSPIVGPDPASPITHATYFDDFFEGGFTKDEGLTDETHNTGKFTNIAEGGAWNVSFHSGGDGVSTDETLHIANAGDFGVLQMVTDADDDDVLSMQLNGEAFKLAAGRTIVFETRISVDDADTIDLFIGLGIDDVLPITAISDYVGFGLVDGDPTVMCLTGKNSTGEAVVTGNGTTLTDSATDFSDGTASTNFIVCRFVATSEQVDFYLDGTHIVSHTGANIPDDEHLTPTVAIRNGSAAVSTVNIDYIYCSSTR